MVQVSRSRQSHLHRTAGNTCQRQGNLHSEFQRAGRLRAPDDRRRRLGRIGGQFRISLLLDQRRGEGLRYRGGASEAALIRGLTSRACYTKPFLVFSLRESSMMRTEKTPRRFRWLRATTLAGLTTTAAAVATLMTPLAAPAPDAPTSV